MPLGFWRHDQGMSYYCNSYLSLPIGDDHDHVALEWIDLIARISSEIFESCQASIACCCGSLPTGVKRVGRAWEPGILCRTQPEPELKV